MDLFLKFNGRAIAVPLMLLLLVLFSLAGCGGDKQDDAKTQAGAVPVPDEAMVPETEIEHPNEIAGEVKPFSPAAPEEAEDYYSPTETLEPVGVEAKEPATKVVHPMNPGIDGSKVAQDGGDFSIMIGSFTKEANALYRVEEICKLGFRPVSEQATVDGQKVYRVHLRGIASLEEAESLGFFIMEKRGFDYLVLER